MNIFSGMRLAYLPAYSPDLNPIEEGFSAMKAWIRRHAHFVRSALSHSSHSRAHRVLRQAVFQSMTAEKAKGWYSHSGYIY